MSILLLIKQGRIVYINYIYYIDKGVKYFNNLIYNFHVALQSLKYLQITKFLTFVKQKKSRKRWQKLFWIYKIPQRVDIDVKYF